MTFHSAQVARVYIGPLFAAAYARSVGMNTQTDTHDTTVLANADGTPMTAKQFIAGHNMSSFTAAGPLDTDASANGQYDLITDLQAANQTGPTPITYLPHGNDRQVWMVEAIQGGVDFNSSVAGTADWATACQTTGITDLLGRVIENHTTVTADQNGTSLDNGAATSGGAVFHLHVTGFSGLTDDVITVEDSADDSSFATIGTFTTVTGVTSQRLTVAGAIRRYVRVVHNVTGTGSVVHLAAICRR
jgi:hypothetical protein